MKRFFSLSQNIPVNQVISTIEEMILKTQDMGDRLIQIEIKPIDREFIMMPLLEYKGELPK